MDTAFAFGGDETVVHKSFFEDVENVDVVLFDERVDVVGVAVEQHGESVDKDVVDLTVDVGDGLLLLKDGFVGLGDDDGLVVENGFVAVGVVVEGDGRSRQREIWR